VRLAVALALLACAAPAAAVQRGAIAVQSRPTGAALFLDGIAQPHLTPTHIEGPVGEKHRVKVMLADYGTWEGDVTFTVEPQSILAVLDPRLGTISTVEPRSNLAVHDPRVGTLSIYYTPYAVIFVDGKRYRQTPYVGLELPPGEHRFELVGRRRTVTVTRTIRPGPNPGIRIRE
jgi:hypothetical protein